MTIVDNNVLSALAKIGQLQLLQEVLETVATTAAVLDELRRAEPAGYKFVSRIESIALQRDGSITVLGPTPAERELADRIRDHALSTTDAQCIAIATTRDRRILTDDAHVGTVGKQRGVEVWDLSLLLKAGVRLDVITTPHELSDIIDDLRKHDNYRFSNDDKQFLFEDFEEFG